MSEPAPELPRQRVWPIFLLAAALATFGFQFVFFAPPEPTPEPSPRPDPFVADQPEPIEISPLSEPVTLSLGVADRSYTLDLRQSRTRGDHRVEAQIVVGVTDRMVADSELPPGATSVIERRYDAAKVEVYDGEPRALAPQITLEVESLIDTAIHRIAMAPTAEVVRSELVSSEVLQLRATLTVLREAIDHLTPRLPREPVRQGESWSWDIPTSLSPWDEDDELTTKLTGNARMTARLLGADPQGRPVLRLEIAGRHEGSSIDAEDHPVSLEYSTTGTGLVVWDAAFGQPLRSELVLAQDARVDDVDIRTRHQLRLDRRDEPE